MTKYKGAIAAYLAFFLVLTLNSAANAVRTTDIDNVIEKTVLDDGDFKIIDSFVAQAIEELVRTRDFTLVARIRSVILSRSNSSKESAQDQYRGQFLDSAYKYISSAFEKAEVMEDEERKVKVIVNLLILVDGLQELRFVDLALGMLNNEYTVIRYWAIHSVTNDAIVEKLNSTDAADLETARRIAERLKGIIGECKPEVLAMISKFGAEVKIAEGEELLLEVVDTRLSQYADWTVEYELLDGAVLKLLYDETNSPATRKTDTIRRFSQLYSYIIQRYVKGKDTLNADQKRLLASVLIETEKSCISELLRPQTVIKRTIEDDDHVGLLMEHNRLLGDVTRAGELPLKLKFDYGENSDGTRRIAPLELPDPPKIEITE
ncbi:MAG: hypothetical protein ACYS0I_04225 [Planctomycetota bacterium]|jgi:hypothetical protein